ncbi:MAG TPA: FkbM family methyltransferase, partial [Gammaproteobacteria bacterium]|nr:FkbM family methyltransferase [Gammaproteobacteria bacterium]
FETILEGLIAGRDMLNVVQVGANDGAHNDPIHAFLMAHRQHTNALLIEPQPELIPHLEAAYAEHPRVAIYNGAIGATDEFVLHRIRPALWGEFRSSYMKGAPAYRAPSGLTSADRAHVLAAARKYLPAGIDAEDAVEAFAVPCRRLSQLLAETGFPTPIQLLQVDAEGADDEVLRACDVPGLRPAVINYESRHLPAARREALEVLLTGEGYRLFHWHKSDTLAVRSQRT